MELSWTIHFQLANGKGEVKMAHHCLMTLFKVSSSRRSVMRITFSLVQKVVPFIDGVRHIENSVQNRALDLFPKCLLSAY